MKYIKVINNSIIGTPTELPVNSENISNFNLLPDDILRTYNWYPFEIETPNLEDDEVIQSWDILIEENRVVRKPKIRKLSEEEISNREKNKIEEEWTNIRKKRNQLLSESDWTQLFDSKLIDSNKSDWQRYRQDLRDLTNAPTPDRVSWPIKPEVIKIPSPPPINIQSTSSDGGSVEESPTEETSNTDGI